VDTHSIVGVDGDAWIDERSQQQYEILLFDEIFCFPFRCEDLVFFGEYGDVLGMESAPCE